MADINGFDANSVPDNDDFSPLPPGEYKVVWTNSPWKPNKAGNGEYIEVTMEVIDGPFTGRKLWDRLNLKNTNQDAVRISEGQLKSACLAVGKMTPKSTEELHDIPMIAKVTIGKPRPGYEASNDIKGYKAVGGGQFGGGQQPAQASPDATARQYNAAVAASQNQAPPPQQAAAGGGVRTAPWNR